MAEYIHPLIAGIIRELPKAGEPMSAQRRGQWVSTFESILDLLYPLPNEQPVTAHDIGGILGASPQERDG